MKDAKKELDSHLHLHRNSSTSRYRKPKLINFKYDNTNSSNNTVRTRRTTRSQVKTSNEYAVKSTYLDYFSAYSSDSSDDIIQDEDDELFDINEYQRSISGIKHHYSKSSKNVSKCKRILSNIYDTVKVSADDSDPNSSYINYFSDEYQDEHITQLHQWVYDLKSFDIVKELFSKTSLVILRGHYKVIQDKTLKE